jgi:mono/diheme cytochrome c family protein
MKRMKIPYDLTPDKQWFLVQTIATFLIFFAAAGPILAKGPSYGETLYHKYCADCHGEKAVGQDPVHLQGGWREDGSRIAPALNGTAHSWHHEPELLYDYVKSGSIDPESPMPSFGEELDDDRIKAIIGYFQSLWPERIRRIYGGRFPETFK